VRQDGVVHDALDLSAFYGDYRADGHGRPAHDPAMMVGLLLYGYAHRCSACVPSGDCRYGLP
jgi:transposase